MMPMRLRQAVIRFALLALAAVAALGFTEGIVRGVVGYPLHPPTRLYRVSDTLGEFDWIRWNPPHAPYWVVEGGNRVFHYNNVGLPGGDVSTTPDAQYVFLLGSSWVEALQVPADSSASSVLQSDLHAEGRRLEVLNLGFSGADPYVAWFRSRFFATRYRPACVVLVLEEFHTRWLARHPQPLQFQLSPRFGTLEPRGGLRGVESEFRARSAFANLLANGMSNRPAEGGPAQGAAVAAAYSSRGERMPSQLQECLRQFHRDYGDRFLLVSLLVDPEQRREVTDFCTAEGLSCVSRPEALRPANRFGGTGHLNVLGNIELGGILHAAIVAHCPQP